MNMKTLPPFLSKYKYFIYYLKNIRAKYIFSLPDFVGNRKYMHFETVFTKHRELFTLSQSLLNLKKNIFK